MPSRCGGSSPPFRTKYKMKKQTLIFLSLLAFFIIVMIINSCRVKTEAIDKLILREKIVKLAISLEGIRYKYGGGDIEGFDCSGFVRYVYSSFGINLPRTAKKQAGLKKRVKFKAAKPGDILIFKIKRRFHTAILIDKYKFIHSPSSSKRIRIEVLNDYWKKHLKKVINLID